MQIYIVYSIGQLLDVELVLQCRIDIEGGYESPYCYSLCKLSITSLIRLCMFSLCRISYDKEAFSILSAMTSLLLSATGISIQWI